MCQEAVRLKSIEGPSPISAQGRGCQGVNSLWLPKLSLYCIPERKGGARAAASLSLGPESSRVEDQGGVRSHWREIILDWLWKRQMPDNECFNLVTS